MAVLFVAKELGKFPHEVEEAFTPTDLAEFLAYINIERKEQKKEYDRQVRLNKNKTR